MALSNKITKAVKDAQKQAEAAAADVRGQLDEIEGRLPEISVDATPFYAVVGAPDNDPQTSGRTPIPRARRRTTPPSPPAVAAPNVNEKEN